VSSADPDRKADLALPGQPGEPPAQQIEALGEHRGVAEPDSEAFGDDEPLKQWGARTFAFLVAIREYPNVKAAAEISRSCKWSHYRRLERIPEYKAVFEACWKIGFQRLEDEATRRAVKGWLEPVYGEITILDDAGKPLERKKAVIGHKQKFSDRLLLARLEAERPDKYRKNLHLEGDVNFNLAERLIRARKRLPPADESEGS
jgi:hypothetical protein